MLEKDLSILLELVKDQYLKNSIGPLYTGEMELLLSSEELVTKLNTNADGQKYLLVLTENTVNLRANNLFQAEKIDDKNYLLIPDWDMFITALDIYIKLTKFIQRRPEHG